MTHDAIPTVDLADLRSHDAEAKLRAARAIALGFGRYGLVYVRTHGVSDASRLYDRYLEFCARPDADKQPYNRGDLWYQRG